MEPFKKDFNRIVTSDDVNNTIEESRKFLNKTKKPVKFTWKGAVNLLATMSNTPLSYDENHLWYFFPMIVSLFV